MLDDDVELGLSLGRVAALEVEDTNFGGDIGVVGGKLLRFGK